MDGLLFEFSRKAVICDVGAALIDGQFGYQRLIESNFIKLIGFEPDDSKHKELQDVDGDVEFLPFFIGDGGEHKFHQNKFDLTNSLYPTNTSFIQHYNDLPYLMATQSTVPCQTVTLDEALDGRDVDFLKIDVQGASKMVLDHAPETLKRCLIVEAEAELNPLYRGEALFGEIDAVMRQHGYMLYRLGNISRLSILPTKLKETQEFIKFGQHGWCDPVYVPDHDRLMELEQEDIIRLAVMITLLYGLSDYAIHALFRLDQRDGTEFTMPFSKSLAENTPTTFTIDGKSCSILWEG
ncbi:MAG: FkbM family methyltransferase [Pseudomonadota bacterium]